MSLKEVRHCDVHENCTKDVYQYKVSVHLDCAVETEHFVDLCPRGLKRLLRFVERGVTAPKKADEQVPR